MLMLMSNPICVCIGLPCDGGRQLWGQFSSFSLLLLPSKPAHAHGDLIFFVGSFLHERSEMSLCCLIAYFLPARIHTFPVRCLHQKNNSRSVFLLLLHCWFLFTFWLYAAHPFRTKNSPHRAAILRNTDSLALNIKKKIENGKENFLVFIFILMEKIRFFFLLHSVRFPFLSVANFFFLSFLARKVLLMISIKFICENVKSWNPSCAA